MNTYERNIDILHRALDVATLRYQVSANNLANSETPNFKRSAINFEAQLKRAFQSEATAKDAFHMRTSDERHIQSTVPYNYQDVSPRRVTDYSSTSKANGNNVDAEQEAQDILKTQMNYRLLTQLASFEFSQMHTVLK